jgi:hypothetical protein
MSGPDCSTRLERSARLTGDFTTMPTCRARTRWYLTTQVWRRMAWIDQSCLSSSKGWCCNLTGFFCYYSLSCITTSGIFCFALIAGVSLFHIFFFPSFLVSSFIILHAGTIGRSAWVDCISNCKSHLGIYRINIPELSGIMLVVLVVHR